MKNYVKQLKESLDKMSPEEQKTLDDEIRKKFENSISVDEYLERIGYKDNSYDD